jgi:hypothetical protein
LENSINTLDYYSDVFPKSRYPSYKLGIHLLF